MTRLSSFLAASLALAAPYSAGMPALDSGRREPRLGPRVVLDDRRQRSTWRQPEVDRDAVPEHVQREAIERAAARRARREAGVVMTLGEAILTRARRGLVLVGDCRERLRELPAESVQCVVTSPPYWQLRDYGVEGQLGLEPTPQAFVAALVEVMREVRRVLRRDGTLWVNLGDTYAAGMTGGFDSSTVTSLRNHKATQRAHLAMGGARHRRACGLPPKSLVGIPWRFALAMQDDGWILRSDIVWHKPNPMPESVRDRPTRAHEYVFLFARGLRYVYDARAIAEPLLHPEDATAADASRAFSRRRATVVAPTQAAAVLDAPTPTTKNARSVWSIPTTPSGYEHFATFPRELARRCIAAGTRPGDVVLDPFAGVGTTPDVALRMGRGAIAIEISPEYAAAIECRLTGVQMPIGAVV